MGRGSQPVEVERIESSEREKVQSQPRATSLNDQPRRQTVVDPDGNRGGTDAGQFGKKINDRLLDRVVSRVVMLLIGGPVPSFDLADHAADGQHRLAAGNPERLDPAESDAAHERDQPP
jgi:hypothetical protein